MVDDIPPGLPPRRPGDFPIIPLEPGAKPVFRPAYKLSPLENEELKRQIQVYLDKGWIVPSSSPWGAPCFLVKKPHSNKMRMVCDWRGLNRLTIRNRFSLPNPEQLFDKLAGMKWVTKMDATQCFHQIRLTEEEQDYSAITTRYGKVL